MEETGPVCTMVFHENVAARPTAAIVSLDAPLYLHPTPCSS